jgi:hypothetical protein
MRTLELRTARVGTPALMKITVVVLVTALLGSSVFAADKRYSRAEALVQLQSSTKGAQIVMVAKTEKRRGKLVLVCLEVIKASKGLPAIGDVVPVNAALPDGREGIVFMPAYPVEAFSGEIRWLRDGNLNECRELSLIEIKHALRPGSVEAAPAAEAKS